VRAPKLLVLDEDGRLCHQVETVAAGLRPRPSIVPWKAGDGVEDIVTTQGPFDVLVAGPVMASDEGLRRLRHLHVRAPETKVVLAFDRLPSRSLREMVRTGAVDILKLPVRDADLLESVEQALEVGARRVVDSDHQRTAGGTGTVVAVLSATGGCGKTFLATNVAYYFSRQGRRTCLIDLDLQFGELSSALRLKPKATIADLTASTADDEDLGRRLEECLERHDSGIEILAAPEEPVEADGVEPADVARVIQAAQSRFDCVVLDTPAALTEVVLVAIEHADYNFALATLDLPSVRNMGALLATLTKLKVPADRVKLVLNKVERDVGMDVERIQKYFPQGFTAVIPYAREVNRALNMGVPMLAFAPRTTVSKALESSLAELFDVGPAASDGREDGRRWFGRRRKLSS